MATRRVMLATLTLLAVVGAGACTQDGSEAAKTIEVEGLAFDLPGGWQQEEPSSKMRAVQASVPGEAGPAQFAVFHFGEGKGGSADDNIRRWISQIDFAPGSTDARQQFDVHGFLITFVDFAGTLKPGPMAGGPAEPQAEARLLGAVVEGPGGPWFFKATGPSKTLGAQRDAFLKMLESIRSK